MTTRHFVSVLWLLDRINDSRLRIIDARNIPHGVATTLPSGWQQYLSGHIPGAIHLDYAHELADPATPYATRVAPGEMFGQVVGAKGIGDDSIVLAYDAGTIPFAARIVWNFLYHGHEEAYILEGGLAAWVKSGHPLAHDVPTSLPAVFTPREQARLRATRDEVVAVAEGRLPVQLLETQRDTTYAQRERDIAGAVRLSGSELLEDHRDGRIADMQTLSRLVSERHLDREKRTIVSCGSGVSAAGSYFALKAAGFADVAVYDGSWLEWQHDELPSVPKATIAP